MTKLKNEIHSVHDLLNIQQDLGLPEDKKTRFFRGHADLNYCIVPSIYREKYLIENEDKIIRDAFTHCSNDFSPNETLFEKIVKLQHYGYATRLLDLTTNALVALYFAASSQPNKDGEFIIFDIPNEQIKYDDSDTVAVLSAISLQNKLFNYDECLKNAKASAQNELKTKSLDYTYNETKRLEMKQRLEEIKPELTGCFDLKGNLCNIDEETEIAFNNQPAIASLLHCIRTDKPSFLPKIKSDDLQRVLCVRAKLNNARILQQQGCFLLFGIADCKINPANIPDDWQRVPNKTPAENKFIVKKEYKEKIMQELRDFGISKQTLFPELESQAKEIMNQYKPK